MCISCHVVIVLGHDLICFHKYITTSYLVMAMLCWLFQESFMSVMWNVWRSLLTSRHVLLKWLRDSPVWHLAWPWGFIWCACFSNTFIQQCKSPAAN